MKRTAKFLLSVQVNKVDVDIDYTVTPGSRSWQQDGLTWHEWEYNPKSIFVAQVIANKTQQGQSHIIVANLQANQIPLNQIDQFGVYKRSDTNQVVPGTYGYMSWPGTYTFKIRFSPQVHNYISYFLKVCSHESNS
jgi:hypothetical protein